MVVHLKYYSPPLYLTMVTHTGSITLDDIICKKYAKTPANFILIYVGTHFYGNKEREGGIGNTTHTTLPLFSDFLQTC